MTTEQINAQMDAEFKNWNDAVFDLAPLPKDFIERFKIAIFRLPVKAHQLNTATIKRIIGKKVKDLTNLDVPIIINAIQLLPLCDYADTLEKGIEKNLEIESVKITYNLTVQKMNAEMETKRQNLITLNSKSPQPLKLIKAQA